MYPKDCPQAACGKRETTVLLVYLENYNLDRLTNLCELRWVLNLLCPREVRDVDKSVNTFLEFNEDTEVSEVANLSCVLRAFRILSCDSLPWIFLKLLCAERHLALVAVESEDNSLYLVANLHEVLSRTEVLAPRHL